MKILKIFHLFAVPKMCFFRSSICGGVIITMPIYLLNLIESEEDRINLSKLYEDYKKYLYAIAFDMSKSTEIADEALSETFISVISVYEKIRDFSPVQMKSFLRIIIRNETIDLIKERNKIIEYSADYDVDLISDEEMHFAEYSQKELISAMTKIKDAYREILIMCYVDEIDLSDISKLLNISYENAKKRLQRARTALRKNLEAYHE